MTPSYRVIRSGRKTLCLEVSERGEVLVRAPHRISQRAIDAFVESHRDWLSRAKMRQEARSRFENTLDEDEIERLKTLAKAYIPPRVAHYASLMGVTPTGVRITSAQKRFGSCSPQNSLSFSWRVMRYPLEAVDYVIVHELAHIRHHDHSKRFYDEVKAYMPDYKERHQLLKTIPEGDANTKE